MAVMAVLIDKLIDMKIFDFFQMVSEDDPYAHVARGKLNLKKDAGIKKKKKKKDKKVLEQQVAKTMESNAETEVRKERGPTKTKAEIAFQKMQEKMVRFKRFMLVRVLTCGLFCSKPRGY